MRTKHFFIPSLHCRSCQAMIEAEVLSLPGVIVAQAIVEKKTLVADFDETAISAEQIADAVRKMDYEVVNII